MTGKSFDQLENPTVGGNYQLLSNEIDGIHVEIQLWDTAGQERYRSLIPVYFRNAVGSLFVFDLTNRDSYNNLEHWISIFSEIAGNDALMIVVGNKSDLLEKYEVTNSEAKAWADLHGYFYFNVSAKTGEGISELFESLSKKLIRSKVTSTNQNNILPTKQEQSDCC